MGGVADILGRTQSRLGDTDDFLGQRCDDGGGVLGIDAECVQVALVDANEPCTARQRDLRLIRVVYLDQGAEADLEGQCDVRGEFLRSEDRRYEQDATSAHLGGVEDIVLTDGEVLAQDGDRDGGDDRLEVGARTREMRFVGENRDGGRSPCSYS